MSDHSKIFTYEAEGLMYTVTVYEDNGNFFADITVTEGAMDVNAIYLGDDDFSGLSDMLNGPLNMNGAKLDGETAQWDDAMALSDPGLGPEGTDKETYLETGDTLTVTLDITSLDEVDVFGIRATSTTTEDGSIKAISDDPEEPEEEDPLYEKVFFGEQFSETGFPESGTFILDEEPDPNIYNNIALPEGTEPTFENYLSYFLSDEIGGDLSTVEALVFYGTDDEGVSGELFRLEAPDGGFQDADELLTAYYDLIDGDSADDATSTSSTGDDLIAALSLGSLDETTVVDDTTMPEEDIDLM